MHNEQLFHDIGLTINLVLFEHFLQFTRLIFVNIVYAVTFTDLTFYMFCESDLELESNMCNLFTSFAQLAIALALGSVKLER